MLRSTNFDTLLSNCTHVEQILDLCSRALVDRYPSTEKKLFHLKTTRYEEGYEITLAFNGKQRTFKLVLAGDVDPIHGAIVLQESRYQIKRDDGEPIEPWSGSSYNPVGDFIIPTPATIPPNSGNNDPISIGFPIIINPVSPIDPVIPDDVGDDVLPFDILPPGEINEPQNQPHPNPPVTSPNPPPFPLPNPDPPIDIPTGQQFPPASDFPNPEGYPLHPPELTGTRPPIIPLDIPPILTIGELQPLPDLGAKKKELPFAEPPERISLRLPDFPLAPENPKQGVEDGRPYPQGADIPQPIRLAEPIPGITNSPDPLQEPEPFQVPLPPLEFLPDRVKTERTETQTETETQTDTDIDIVPNDLGVGTQTLPQDAPLSLALKLK